MAGRRLTRIGEQPRCVDCLAAAEAAKESGKQVNVAAAFAREAERCAFHTFRRADEFKAELFDRLSVFGDVAVPNIGIELSSLDVAERIGLARFLAELEVASRELAA